MEVWQVVLFTHTHWRASYNFHHPHHSFSVCLIPPRLEGQQEAVHDVTGVANKQGQNSGGAVLLRFHKFLPEDVLPAGDTGDKDPNTHQAHAGYIGSTDNK